MNFSAWFIRRPVGTSLIAVAITLVGAICYFLLPVSPLPQVEYPTINIGAGLPGASSETMASAVATPLERQFGLIAGVTEMTSQSTLGQSSITLQFDLDRNIDAATRDVQAAIANQTNARATSQFNAEQTNTVGAANADRDLKAATTNQANTSGNNQFNAAQTNNVNVAGYQGDVSQRGTDIAAGLTMRGQDINAQTSRESLALGRDKQNHDENKDYIELAAAGAKGLTDAYAYYDANSKKTTAPAPAKG